MTNAENMRVEAVAELKEEIERLTEANDDLQRGGLQLTEEVADYRNTITDLEVEIERLTDAVKKVTSERDFAINEMRELQKKLTVAEMMVDEATARRCVEICEKLSAGFASAGVNEWGTINDKWDGMSEGAEDCASNIKSKLLEGGK